MMPWIKRDLCHWEFVIYLSFVIVNLSLKMLR